MRSISAVIVQAMAPLAAIPQKSRSIVRRSRQIALGYRSAAIIYYPPTKEEGVVR